MMISTKGVNADEKGPSKLSKWVSYGINELKINSIDVRVSSTGTGSFVLIFNMESPKVTTPGFEGHEGALGKIGRIQFPGSYVLPNDEKKMDKLVKDLCIIADKLGVREQLDAVQWEDTDNIQSYFKKVEPIFQGKYAMWKIRGEETTKADGSPSLRLSVATFKFIQSLDSYKEKPELTFDKNDKWDFKPRVQPDAVPEGSGAKDDLPF